MPGRSDVHTGETDDEGDDPVEAAQDPQVAGWREWVTLPDLDVAWVKAKLDTGARTSSLHAWDIEEFERDGRVWLRYTVLPWQDSSEDQVRLESPLHDQRAVRSSSGHAEERHVVTMLVRLLDRTVTAEVTLTNRDDMGFRMLVGREALRQGFLVDSSRSYVGPRPPLALRRRNRGR
ncbi:RimK/LysX family protein [Nocardioidaceae bacterium]|nr:RimK/LysX family protein [Nocardioidaceae bacterium]